jgi:hypothetical protein
MYRYVPRKCAGTPPAWTHIPQAALSILGEPYAAWKTAYGAAFGEIARTFTAEFSPG